MRELGPTRKITDGDPVSADAQIGVARTQLGILKNLMRLGAVSIGVRTIRLPDGTELRVSSVNGQDLISIVTPVAASPGNDVPEITVPAVGRMSATPPPVPGNTEVYSGAYLTNVFKGAVMNRAGTATVIAVAYPTDVDQTGTIFTGPDASRLIQLDAKLQETGATPIAAPDWLGQLTYDFTGDRFFLNVFSGVDPQFAGQPHRALLEITAAGGQTVIDGEEIDAALIAFPNWLWGNSLMIDWVWGWGTGVSVDAVVTARVSSLTPTVFPISQPCTSGLIAAMFTGDNTSSQILPIDLEPHSQPGVYNVHYADFQAYNDAAGGAAQGGTVITQTEIAPAGYAFLWDTRAQSIAYRGGDVATYDGAYGGYDGVQAQFDPWAYVTPLGNVIFSMVESPDPSSNLGAHTLLVQSMGAGTTDIGSPPAGVVDLVMTKGDKAAYAITADGLFNYVKGAWKNITPASIAPANMRALLHDLVTDAVALVLGDGSGAMIYNGRTLAGQPLAPFKVGFARAPTRVAANIFPQQFLNGTMLITYAPEGAPNMAMPYSGLPGQWAPAWSAQAADSGGRMLTTAISWVVGRYDIGALKT